MGYRVLEDIDNKILDAVIAIGAKEGVPKVSASKIAKKCNISTFTIFEHFKTMRACLDMAAEKIDTFFMEKMRSLVAKNLSKSQIYNVMLDEFIASPKTTLYYISYTNTFGFDPSEKNDRAQVFLSYANLYLKPAGHSDIASLLAWDYITSMAFYYAEKIIHGYINNDEQTRNIIIDIIFKKSLWQ